ncbi:MAG: hypothetical protein H7840_09440 [Alphaproteobacteria bacterium]
MRGALRARRLLRSTLQAALFLFDTLLLPFLRPGRHTGRDILLLIRMDGIGDFVLFLPLARRILAAWHDKGGEAVLVMNQASSALVAGLEGVADVISIDRKRFRLDPAYRFRRLSQIRSLGAHEALDAAFSRDASLGDAVVRFSGAPVRLGWQGDCQNTPAWLKTVADRAYTRLFPNPEGPVNEIRAYESLAEHLGLRVSAPSALPWLATPIEGVPEAYYILAPQAGAGLRQWPADRFAGLAERIHERTGLTGVLVGDGRATGIFRAIHQGCRAPLVDLDGRIGLGKLAGVIAGARFLAGNDSAPIHLAALLGVGTIAALAGAQFGRFLPYVHSSLHCYRAPLAVHHPMPCFGCNWICPFVSSPAFTAPCVERITLDAMWERLLEIPEVTQAMKEPTP